MAGNKTSGYFSPLVAETEYTDEIINEVFRFHGERKLRKYRVQRDWLTFADKIGYKTLGILCQNLQQQDMDKIILPDWLEHPDLKHLNPPCWRDQVGQLLQVGVQDFNILFVDKEPAEKNAIIACLLAATFVTHCNAMQSVFNNLSLPVNNKGYPPESPFKALVILLRQYPTEKQLLEAVDEQCNLIQQMMLRYYLYALNIHFDSTLYFLAET